MFEKVSSALYSTSTTTPQSPNITHIKKKKKIMSDNAYSVDDLVLLESLKLLVVNVSVGIIQTE